MSSQTTPPVDAAVAAAHPREHRLERYVFKGGFAPDVKPEDQPALRPNIVTVFYPGFGACRWQAAKYVSADEGVVVLAREPAHDRDEEEAASVEPTKPVVREDVVLYHARRPGAPRLLHNLQPLPELPEMSGRPSWNPFHWVSKNIGHTVAAVHRIVGVPAGGQHMELTKVNLGGERDQRECRRCIAMAVAAIEREEAQGGGSRRGIVLFGTSRGAATTFSTALRLEPRLARHVKLVILEAPFFSVESVVQESSFLPTLQLTLLGKIGHYNAEHMTPQRAVLTTDPADVAIRCPFAFVTSAVDKRVPESQTLRLMDLLRKHQPSIPVEHLRLRHSHHSAMSVHNEEDRARYIKWIEELYDRCCPMAVLPEAAVADASSSVSVTSPQSVAP